MAKSRYPKLNWEYDFADTIRVICGLVPKKQPKVPDFNPWDWKSYKVENCSQDLINYQKLLAEKGLKDPWIRCVVFDSDYSSVHIFYITQEIKDMPNMMYFLVFILLFFSVIIIFRDVRFFSNYHIFFKGETVYFSEVLIFIIC